MSEEFCFSQFSCALFSFVFDESFSFYSRSYRSFREGKGSGTPKRQENWQKSLKGSTPAKGGNAAERRNAAASGNNAGGSGSSSSGAGAGGGGSGSGAGMSSNGTGGGNNMTNGMNAMGPDKKKRKLSDKILPQKVRDLVPESQVRNRSNVILFGL